MNTNVFGPPNLIEMKVVLSHLECDLGLFWVQDTKPLFKLGTPQRSFIMLGWLGPKPQPLSLSLQSKHSIQCCVNPHRTNYISSLWVFCLLWPFSQLLSALDGQGRVRGGWEEEELAEHWFSRDLAPESPIGHHQFPCPYPYRFVLILLFLILFNPVLYPGHFTKLHCPVSKKFTLFITKFTSPQVPLLVHINGE